MLSAAQPSSFSISTSYLPHLKQANNDAAGSLRGTPSCQHNVTGDFIVLQEQACKAQIV